MSKQILIVDDDELLRRSLAFNLQQAGYRVSTSSNAEEAIEISKISIPNLVLLDIGLPGMDGLDALRYFKDRLALPVIFLTARRRELDEVVGLELGADDYVTKPFDVDVLIARIKAVLRRVEDPAHTPKAREAIIAGDIEIDVEAHTVILKGNLIELSPREFDLLYSLILEQNRVVSVESLLARVWGAEYTGQPQVVYVHIRWLREKIEGDPNHPRRILTVRGKGYKFLPQERL